MKTIAAFLRGFDEPLAVEDNIEVPVLKDGQCLVKLAYSGVCHSQLMEARGRRGEDPYLPHMLGHEGSGVVISVGKAVSKLKEGDRVALGWIKGEGLDPGGCRYRKATYQINAGAVTTFMEFAVVSENRCIKLAAGIPLDIAVLFGCALPTGAGIVMHCLNVQPDTSIVIWGLGGVGLSALMATKLFQFRNVIAVDLEDSKLLLAREFGATHCLNDKDDSAINGIMEITGGLGADYCVEAAGTVTTIEKGLACVRKNKGLCIFASHPKKGDRIKVDPFDLISGKRLQGSWGGDSRPDTDAILFSRLFSEGKLPLGKLIEKRYPLTSINDALADLENRKVTRPLIEIDPGLR